MIRIDATYYLDRYRRQDVQRLCGILNNKNIWETTLRIPYPYLLSDAQAWAERCVAEEDNGGLQKSWALRNTAGEVCGGIGLQAKYAPETKRDEFGYWLMEPLWNQGIMSRTVGIFTDQCFSQYGMLRLEASVFEINRPSGRVLLKNGFKLESRISNAYIKNGHQLDALLYVKNAR